MNGVCELCATLHACITLRKGKSQQVEENKNFLNIINEILLHEMKSKKRKQNSTKSKDPKHIKINSIKMRLRAIFLSINRERNGERGGERYGFYIL